MKKIFFVLVIFFWGGAFNFVNAKRIDLDSMSLERAESQRQKKLPRITANSFIGKKVVDRNVYMRSIREKRFGTRVYSQKKLTRLRIEEKLDNSRKYSTRKFGASSFKRELQKVRNADHKASIQKNTPIPSTK